MLVKFGYIDGKLTFKLPDGVTSQDFVDFLNGKREKPLQFKEQPEMWSSADWTQDEIDGGFDHLSH